MNWCKVRTIIRFNLFLESYNIKIRFSMNFEISMKTWNSIFTYWKDLKRKCVSIIPKNPCDLDLKYLKRISHGQGVFLLLISKRILFDFLNSNICWCHFGGKKNSIPHVTIEMWEYKKVFHMFKNIFHMGLSSKRMIYWI